MRWLIRQAQVKENFGGIRRLESGGKGWILVARP
jgi:hypothetical protein